MDFSELLARLLNAKLDIGDPASCGGRSSATASAWPAPSSACSARSPPGRSASWATSCCSRSSSAGSSTPRRTSTCTARRAGRSSSSSSASTAGSAGSSTASPARRRRGRRTPGAGPGWTGRLQLLVGAVVLWTVFYFVAQGPRLLGSGGRRLDPDRLDPGHLRDGPRLGGVLADLDRGGPGRRAAAARRAGYYPSAIMYIVYGVFCVIGFVSWCGSSAAARPTRDPTGSPIRWSRRSADRPCDVRRGP